MSGRSRVWLAWLAAVLGAGVLGAAVLLVRSGISAREEPPLAERVVARAMRHLAIPASARARENPVPLDEAVLAEARAHFADHCAPCHANDGSGNTAIGRGLYPKAPDMRDAGTQGLSDGELYFIIKNGVRLTGMPAWGEPGDADADTWKLVHFVRHLHALTADQIEEMRRLNPRSPAEIDEERADAAFLNGADLDERPASPGTETSVPGPTGPGVKGEAR